MVEFFDLEGERGNCGCGGRSRAMEQRAETGRGYVSSPKSFIFHIVLVMAHFGRWSEGGAWKFNPS